MVKLTAEDYQKYIPEIKDILCKNDFDGNRICDICCLILQDKLPKCIINSKVHDKGHYSYHDIIINFTYKNKDYLCIIRPRANRIGFFAIEKEDNVSGSNISHAKIFRDIPSTFLKSKLKGVKLLPKHRKYNNGELFILNDSYHKKPTLFKIVGYQYEADTYNLSLSNNKRYYLVMCHNDTRKFKILEKNIKNICNGGV